MEVRFHCQRVTQELTLWSVGAIGYQVEPLADPRSVGSLSVTPPIPSYKHGETEHRATDRMAPLEPLSPLHQEYRSPDHPASAYTSMRHPTRYPAVQKKALLIGISYDHTEVGREWGVFPTSIHKVTSIATFLRGEGSPHPLFSLSPSLPRNRLIPSRSLRVYQYRHNDRRSRCRREISTHTAQLGSPPPSTSPQIHIP